MIVNYLDNSRTGEYVFESVTNSNEVIQVFAADFIPKELYDLYIDFSPYT